MRKYWPWLAVVGVAFVLLLLVPTPDAKSSALSKGPDGLWALRSYLEKRGVDVTLLDAPLEEATVEADVIVLALPWQKVPSLELGRMLKKFLRDGGDLLLAYEGGSEDDFGQSRLFDILGLEPILEARSSPPLKPRAWWTYRQQVWTLTSEDSVESLEVPAFRWAPTAPRDADVHFSLPVDTDVLPTGGAMLAAPAVFSVDRHGGQVTVMPVAALANAGIEAADNLAWVERLVARHGDRWVFDEYHHGLVRPDLVERSVASHAWDLFIVHLLVLYVLALIAGGRQFGPVWREKAIHSGSTTDFLRHLGVLHHDLGHHRAAAQQLLDRARRLRPGFIAPQERPEDVENGADLVRLAVALEEKAER